MTGPIKPPGGGSIGVGGPGDPSGPRPSGERFEATLDRVSAPKSDSIAPTPLAGARAISADLRAGRLEASAAVDRIVAEALASPMAAGLDRTSLAELEAHLRSQLAEDPTLQSMTADLDRRE